MSIFRLVKRGKLYGFKRDTKNEDGSPDTLQHLASGELVLAKNRLLFGIDDLNITMLLKDISEVKNKTGYLKIKSYRDDKDRFFFVDDIDQWIEYLAALKKRS